MKFIYSYGLFCFCKEIFCIIHNKEKIIKLRSKKVIDCVPDVAAYIYHTLHSLDVWYINTCDENYSELRIHRENLNNLDIKPADNIKLSRADIDYYYNKIRIKINNYLSELNDNLLCEKPDNCNYDRFTLILAQFRHLHSHMGMLMGVIIDDTGLWPRVLGLELPIPNDDTYNKYF